MCDQTLRRGNKNPANGYLVDDGDEYHVFVVTGGRAFAAEFSAWLVEAAQTYIAAGNLAPIPEDVPLQNSRPSTTVTDPVGVSVRQTTLDQLMKERHGKP